MSLYQTKYYDFGPTFASEKLEELDKIKIDHDTLRLWLKKAGIECIWTRKKKKKHRKWRERKACCGQMIQLDGSIHKWLEDRSSERIVLLGYVDDATNRVYARFYRYEGTLTAFDSFKRYVRKYGLPLSVYVDKHSTYKTTRDKTKEEELLDQEAVTQFGRAMEELGVNLIFAHSAQAKGRVERLFKTFQDRLVKEMRLANIKTLEEANKFLELYLPKYNKKFNVLPKSEADVHRKAPPAPKLDSILCKKTVHFVYNDSTIRHDNKYYLIENVLKRAVKHVIVEERINGKMLIKQNNKTLKYKEIDKAIKVSELVKEPKPVVPKKKKQTKPAKNHPWRIDKVIEDQNLTVEELEEAVF